jgi:hypothetical protein
MLYSLCMTSPAYNLQCNYSFSYTKQYNKLHDAGSRIECQITRRCIHTYTIQHTYKRVHLKYENI